MIASRLGLKRTAQTVGPVAFVNGLALNGALTDLSAGGTDFDRRVGYFSDIAYDAQRNEWWALSDRGPGGGTLSYETRVQRFTLDIDANTGAISNFAIAQTLTFTSAGAPMNGLAPNPAGTLGLSLDPEGLAINPANGHLLVADDASARTAAAPSCRWPPWTPSSSAPALPPGPPSSSACAPCAWSTPTPCRSPSACTPWAR